MKPLYVEMFNLFFLSAVRCIVGRCLLDDGNSCIGSLEMHCSFFHERLQVLDALCHLAQVVFNGHLSSHRNQLLAVSRLLRYHENVTLRSIFLSQTFTSVSMSVASLSTQLTETQQREQGLTDTSARLPPIAPGCPRSKVGNRIRRRGIEIIIPTLELSLETS